MRTMMKPTVVAALLTLAGAMAHAECTLNSGNEGFSPYRENFAIFNQMYNNGWADKDETAMRVQYSTKYSFYGCDVHKLTNTDHDKGDFFLSYTGLFDFYMLSRYSDPVINRMSNIGLHYRLPVSLTTFLNRGWLEVAVEHRSDGQVFEPGDGSNAATLEQAYQKADASARRLFDTLSRGSNYLSLQARWETTASPGLFRFRASSHEYFSQNTEVTWGPLKNQGRTIRDYDLAQLGVEYEHENIGTLGVYWRVGSAGLKADSFDLMWHFPKTPLMLRGHVGPMNTLSNYTQPQNSIGFGLLFFN